MIGIDIAKISRFEKHVENFKFHKKILNKNERIRLKNIDGKKLAVYFSAKESVSKALGTGIGKINWHDIEINHYKSGKPYAKYKDPFDNRVKMMHLSISHDGEYVISQAMKTNYFSLINPPKLKKRQIDVHKGDMGRALIIGGSKGMSGSIVLSAQSALRTGCGYSYIMCPKDIHNIVANHIIEPIILGDFSDKEKVKNMDAIAIGPGLGTSNDAFAIFKNIVKDKGCPLVIDADGLNILAKKPKLLKKINREIVLTPHGGELKRLKNTFGDNFYRKKNIVLVKKGPETLVFANNGYYKNNTGGPGLATAGSGNVLTGVIVSLIAQGYDTFEAAKIGTYIHGAARDYISEEIGVDGLIASDIIDAIPKVMKKIYEFNIISE